MRSGTSNRLACFMVTLKRAAGVSPADRSVTHCLILPPRCRQYAKQILERLAGQRLMLINPCSCFPMGIVHTLAIAYEPPQIFPALDSVRFAILFLFVLQLRGRQSEEDRAHRRADHRPSKGGARIREECHPA